MQLLTGAGAKQLQVLRVAAALVDALDYPPIYVASCFTGPADWLDSIKLGYGARFAAAFAASGFDDTEDIKLCPPDAATLAALLRTAGAGTPQQHRIQAGVVALLGGPVETFNSARLATVLPPPAGARRALVGTRCILE